MSDLIEADAPSLWLDVEDRAVPVWVRNPPGQPKRVVITSHGLTNDHHDAPLFHELRVRLDDEAGDVLLVEFDYPGSGLAAGELKDKRFWILEKTLCGVVNRVRAELAPGLPVSIVGRSMGGTVALATVPHTKPERMAVMSPPFELTQSVAALRGEMSPDGLYPLPASAAPSGQVKGAVALSPELFAELAGEEERVRAGAEVAENVLLISSTEDPKVGSGEMEALWAVLGERGGNRHEVVDSDHNYEAVGDEVVEMLINWIYG